MKANVFLSEVSRDHARHQNDIHLKNSKVDSVCLGCMGTSRNPPGPLAQSKQRGVTRAIRSQDCAWISSSDFFLISYWVKKKHLLLKILRYYTSELKPRNFLVLPYSSSLFNEAISMWKGGQLKVVPWQGLRTLGW